MAEAAGKAERSVLLLRRLGFYGDSTRSWKFSGSGICVAPRLLITCFHVVRDRTEQFPRCDLLSQERAAGLRETVAVQDRDGAWRTPNEIHYDLERDIALLKFASPLRSPPATCAIDLTKEICERIKHRSWHAFGYPDFEMGHGTHATLLDGLAVFTSNDDRTLTLQIKGGLKPGYSGGAFIWQDHPEQPVVGMPQMGGGEMQVSAACTMEAILHVMQQWRASPARIVSLADLMSDKPNHTTPAAELDRRRTQLLELTSGACSTARELGLELTPIPHGRVLCANDQVREIHRPVAIMLAPMTRKQLGVTGEWDAATRMATDISRLQIEQIAKNIPTPRGGHWRLPTRAEWWMAVTAGQPRGQARSLSPLPQFFSINTETKNRWGVLAQPRGSMEWLAQEAGEPDAAINFLGGCQPLAPFAALRNVGFRLVWDPLDGVA